ncbi:MAG: DUF6328 family protein [Candidatus Angelobacter sp.]
MPTLDDAIENVLNETRILLLGGQVLLGFSFRICFEERFEQIARPAQVAEIAGLGIMTAALGWLIWPAAFHQIKENGRTTASVHTFTTNVLDWALLPFALGLALTLYTVSTALEVPYSSVIGAAAGTFAIAIWYGWPRAGRQPGAKQKVQKELIQQEQEDRDKPDLPDRIKKVLIECRMALPGAQAFLGFQFAIVFARSFEHLQRFWQVIHFVSLLATTIATVLLIAPAAYHRIHEAGEDTEQFRKVASRLLLAALVFLGPGMAGDLFVVIAKETQSPAAAGAIAGLLLLAFYGLWFGVSAWRRK